MSIRLLLVIAVLAVVPSASAQWTDPKTGEPAPENDCCKRSGEFSAMLQVIENPQGFFTEWYGTPERHKPEVKTANTAHVGDTLGAVLLYADCAPEGQRCSRTVDFTVWAPDGSVYGSAVGHPVTTYPAPKRHIISLSQANMLIRIEPNDLAGHYLVEATLREPLLGLSMSLKQSFTVTK